MFKYTYKNKLAYYLEELNVNSKFNIIDIGAKEDIGETLKIIPENQLNIYGFEPNKIEFEKLIKKFPQRKYFNIGVFNNKKNKKLYVTKEPAASSFFKPNNKNKIYEKINWENRKIVKITNIKCDKLDSFSKIIKEIDFLKIDTQGSEYQILEGAKKVLNSNSPLVLTETWSTEIYKNINLFDEIIFLMKKMKYRVLDIDTAAASWKLETKNKFTDLDIPIKNGFEILFVKDYEILKKLEENKIIKLIILLDLFGYKSFACHLLEKNKNISKKNYICIYKKINYLNIVDKLFSMFPINILIKILVRYKIINPINPQLHY